MTSIRQILGAARRAGLRLAVGAAGALPLVLVPTAGAQGFGPDPFRPYNSQYDSAVFPIAPGPMSAFGNTLTNQNLGVRGANQFENYLESIGEGRAGTRRYDQANRAYDRQFGRQYQPNRKADAGFQERQSEISDLYFRYLRENDPRKRAALLQQYKQARAQATRDLNVGGRNSRTGRSARPPVGEAPNAEAPELDERSELDPQFGVGAARSSAARRVGPRRASPPAEAATTTPPAAPAEGRAGGLKPSQILERAQESEIPPAPSLPGAGAREIPPAPPTRP